MGGRAKKSKSSKPSHVASNSFASAALINGASVVLLVGLMTLSLVVFDPFGVVGTNNQLSVLRGIRDTLRERTILLAESIIPNHDDAFVTNDASDGGEGLPWAPHVGSDETPFAASSYADDGSNAGAHDGDFEDADAWYRELRALNVMYQMNPHDLLEVAKEKVAVAQEASTDKQLEALGMPPPRIFNDDDYLMTPQERKFRYDTFAADLNDTATLYELEFNDIRDRLRALGRDPRQSKRLERMRAQLATARRAMSRARATMADVREGGARMLGSVCPGGCDSEGGTCFNATCVCKPYFSGEDCGQLNISIPSAYPTLAEMVVNWVWDNNFDQFKVSEWEREGRRSTAGRGGVEWGDPHRCGFPTDEKGRERVGKRWISSSDTCVRPPSFPFLPFPSFPSFPFLPFPSPPFLSFPSLPFLPLLSFPFLSYSTVASTRGPHHPGHQAPPRARRRHQRRLSQRRGEIRRPAQRHGGDARAGGA